MSWLDPYLAELGPGPKVPAVRPDATRTRPPPAPDRPLPPSGTVGPALPGNLPLRGPVADALLRFSNFAHGTVSGMLQDIKEHPVSGLWNMTPPGQLLSGGKEAIKQAAGGNYAAAGIAALGAIPMIGEPGEGRFFSRLERRIGSAPFEKGTAEQWMAHLSKDVAKGEREWTGVDSFLNQNSGKVLTKQQVQDVFQQGKINLTETQLAAQPPIVTQRLTDAKMAHYNAATAFMENARQLGLNPTQRMNAQQYMMDSELPISAVMERYDMPPTPENLHLANTLRNTANDLRQAHSANDNFPLAKYENYTENGGTNYRELLLQLAHPEFKNGDQLAGEMYGRGWGNLSPAERAQVSARLDANAQTAPFESGHFDQTDILAHLRMKDRALPNDEKALFLEELQSDWHQQGREKGYQSREVLDPLNSRIAQLRSQLYSEQEAAHARALQNAREQISVGPTRTFQMFDDPRDGGLGRPAGYMANLTEANIGDASYKIRSKPNGDLTVYGGKGNTLGNTRATSLEEALETIVQHHAHRMMPDDPEYTKVWRALSEATQQKDAITANGVPDAPFKKTEDWMGLALKRALDEAARGSYDRLAWTTGEQQAERYKLAKHVDELTYNPGTSYFNAYKGGQSVHSGLYEPEDLPGLIGKDAAAKLLATPQNGVNQHVLRGLDFNFGGEGMKAFYDRMIPNYLRDYGKKLGVPIAPEPTTFPDLAKFDPKRDAEALKRYGQLAPPEERDALSLLIRTANDGTNIRDPDVMNLLSPLERDIASGVLPKVPSFSGTQQSIRITPDLRQKILGQGQPMWAALAGLGLGGAAYGAAQRQPQQQQQY